MLRRKAVNVAGREEIAEGRQASAEGRRATAGCNGREDHESKVQTQRTVEVEVARTHWADRRPMGEGDRMTAAKEHKQAEPERE